MLFEEKQDVFDVSFALEFSLFAYKRRERTKRVRVRVKVSVGLWWVCAGLSVGG